MKAAEFSYHRPETVDAALALMASGEAQALAGGQSLMPMMNFRLAGVEDLVDLNRLPDLAGIAVADGWLTIGAMTRYAALEADPLVAQHAPLMAKALPHIAHSAIRNRGTLGGSCALADPAAEMPAVLLALGAEISLRSQSSARRVAAADFFTGLYETTRAPEELITAVHVPLRPRQRCGFYEVTRRHGDYAMAGCAITASEDLGDLRIALFAVADRPIRLPGAEAALPADLPAALQGLASLAFTADLYADEATKRHLAGVALTRAWAEVGP